jgi:uncharacterized membrane protein
MPAPMGQPAPFGIGESVGYGWTAYWKNVGPMLLITLVIVVINLIVGLVGIPFSNVGIRVLFQIIGAIVGLLLALGLIRASLAVTAGRKPEVSMLFEGENLGPYIIASLIFAAPFFVAGLLSLVSPILTLVVDIGLIYFAVTFGFYGFVIVDKGEQDPIAALKASAAMTAGNRGQIFLLGIVLALIAIVGFCAFCVGALFTYGIVTIAWAYTYRSLSGESVATP